MDLLGGGVHPLSRNGGEGGGGGGRDKIKIAEKWDIVISVIISLLNKITTIVKSC